jgi:hypothetical protein
LYYNYSLIVNDITRLKWGRLNRVPFGFFFYKVKLILCTTLRQDLHLTKKSFSLFTNLVVENVALEEKKLILGYP